VIVPGRMALLCAVLLALLLIGALIAPVVAVAVLAADLLLLVVCWVQGRVLKNLAIDVVREPWRRVQVGRSEQFSYRLTNRSKAGVIVRIRQPWPDTVDCEVDLLEIRLAPGEIVRTAMTATPRVRGVIAVPPLQVDMRFPIDLACRRWSGSGAELKVFPSLKGLVDYDALQRHHASSYGGLHQQRMLGAGREFDRLRDYFPDDDFRDLNWKATARHRKPFTNLYQAERSRDVILCLDCGRMMGNPMGKGTAIDCAIDASIMLAHVASRQGDRVGLALFSDTVHRFLKPGAGIVTVNRIIEELVDTRTNSLFPSYSSLITAIRAHQTRRSLIFIFTDLNDPQLAENLAQVLPLATRKHVLVVISLRDPLLDRYAGGAASDGRDVFKVLAARQLANERATRIRQLHKIGATVVEADAGSISVKLLNTYLAIKSRQLI
jgi:uncharacterized protein (DUF58 family)